MQLYNSSKRTINIARHTVLARLRLCFRSAHGSAVNRENHDQNAKGIRVNSVPFSESHPDLFFFECKGTLDRKVARSGKKRSTQQV